MVPFPQASPHLSSAKLVSVMQGDIYCRLEPSILTTVLGSCVAVCLWDRTCHAGGMNHFVLPCDPRGEQNSRYGIVAMAELLAGMMELGCRLPQLRAKVFGGAAVLPAGAGRTVGMSNVEVALETLRHAHIPVIAQRTGGLLGLHIKFHTASGEVFVRYLSDGIRNSQPGLPRT